jgi:hypothetical protein
MEDNVDLNDRLAQMAINLAYATALIASFKNLYGPVDPNFPVVKQLADDMHPALVQWFRDNDEWLRSWKWDIRKMPTY